VITIARGDGGPPAPPAPRPHTLDELLADDAATQFVQRCRVGAWGPLRFAPRSAPHSDAPPQPSRPPRGALVVVEEREELVRVVMEEQGFRLLVWLRREDLAPVPVAATVVSERPGRRQKELVPREGGVRVAPGVDIDEIRRDATGATSMRYFGGTVDGVGFQGWLHDDALGAVYVEETFRPVPSTGLLLEGTSLWSTTPELIARVSDPPPDRAPQFVYGVESLERRDAERLVHLVRPHVEVFGLVPATSVAAKGPEDGEWTHHDGYTSSPHGSPTHAAQRTLPKGAAVFSIEGERVGVVLTDLTVYLGAAIAPARRTIQVLFAYRGAVSLAVRESDLRPTAP
jgi:hypothetical protein